MRMIVLFLAAILFDARAFSQSVDAEIMVHRTLTAGLRHHDAKAVWHLLKPGDRLTLVREPTNDADMNAVRIDWRGYTLGYVPRHENEAIARQLDRGAALEARISELAKYRNHRLKLGVDITLRL